jgi:hypothetical protein
MQHSEKVQYPYFMIVAVDGLLDSLMAINSRARILDAQRLTLSEVVEHCLVFARRHG